MSESAGINSNETGVIKVFDGNLPHYSTDFTGDRYSIIVFGHNQHDLISEDDRKYLRGLGFGLPCANDGEPSVVGHAATLAAKALACAPMGLLGFNTDHKVMAARAKLWSNDNIDDIKPQQTTLDDYCEDQHRAHDIEPDLAPLSRPCLGIIGTSSSRTWRNRLMLGKCLVLVGIPLPMPRLVLV